MTVGVWVRQVLANPQKSIGKYATVATEVLTFEQMLAAWSEVTGKPAVFVETSVEEYERIWGIPGREIAMQLKFGEQIDDWYEAYRGKGGVLTQEELGIKPEEVSGFKYALEQVKSLLL